MMPFPLPRVPTPQEWLIERLADRLAKTQNLFGLLTRLELGVFWFCWRRSRETHNPALKRLLLDQARGEYRHAQILSRYGAELPPKTFLLLTYSADEVLAREEIAGWGGHGASTDGISRRFWFARVFFGDKPADSYPWSDRLAYMIVLERFQAQIYRAIARRLPGKLSGVTGAIALEEYLHAEQLQTALAKADLAVSGEMAIGRWERRLTLALLLFWLSGSKLTYKEITGV